MSLSSGDWKAQEEVTGRLTVHYVVHPTKRFAEASFHSSLKWQKGEALSGAFFLKNTNFIMKALLSELNYLPKVLPLDTTLRVKTSTYDL